MTESPILFSGAMVCAILEGRKTQTRRVIKPQPKGEFVGEPGLREWAGVLASHALHRPTRKEIDDKVESLRGHIFPFRGDHGLSSPSCRYGWPGCKLWVRETWGIADSGGRLLDPCLNYRADGAQKPLHDRLDLGWSPNPVSGIGATSEQILAVKDGWHPSIHMPRWASRITLEITDVRVQRLQKISEEDARAEGVYQETFKPTYRTAFGALWDSINAKRGFGWDVNPWVWALTFKKL